MDDWHFKSLAVKMISSEDFVDHHIYISINCQIDPLFIKMDESFTIFHS